MFAIREEGNNPSWRNREKYRQRGGKKNIRDKEKKKGEHQAGKSHENCFSFVPSFEPFPEPVVESAPFFRFILDIFAHHLGNLIRVFW